LPELIAENAADYEKLALELARDPARLKAAREKLAADRPCSTRRIWRATWKRPIRRC